MPTLWRLCDTRWASNAFSGEGAARYPGRWNSQGRRAVYCAATRSLAALEILSHIEDRALLAKARFVAIPLEVSEDQIQVLRQLPEGWDRVPPADSTRSLGDRFLENARQPVLRVPSAVVPGEYNYLINPQHPAFASLRQGKPEPFAFDPRLAAAGLQSTGAAPKASPGKSKPRKKPVKDSVGSDGPAKPAAAPAKQGGTRPAPKPQP